MDQNKTSIKVEDIKAIVDAILTHIQDDLGINEVELTECFYWEISEKDLYSMDQGQREIVVGSLFDDLEFLTPLLSDRDQAVSLMLLHVAPLLRYIGTKVEQ